MRLAGDVICSLLLPACCPPRSFPTHRVSVDRTNLTVALRLYEEQIRSEGQFLAFVDHHSKTAKMQTALVERFLSEGRRICGNMSKTAAPILGLLHPKYHDCIRYCLPLMHNIRTIGQDLLEYAAAAVFEQTTVCRTAAGDSWLDGIDHVDGGRRLLLSRSTELLGSIVNDQTLSLLQLGASLSETLYSATLHDDPAIVRCGAAVFVLFVAMESFREATTADLYWHSMLDHLVSTLVDYKIHKIVPRHTLEESAVSSFRYVKFFERNLSNHQQSSFQRGLIHEQLNRDAAPPSRHRPTPAAVHPTSFSASASFTQNVGSELRSCVGLTSSTETGCCSTYLPHCHPNRRWQSNSVAALEPMPSRLCTADAEGTRWQASKARLHPFPSSSGRNNASGWLTSLANLRSGRYPLPLHHRFGFC